MSDFSALLSRNSHQGSGQLYHVSWFRQSVILHNLSYTGMVLTSTVVGFYLHLHKLFGQFGAVLNNQQPVRRPALTHDFQAIILMNASVLGHGSSLIALLQTDSLQGWAPVITYRCYWLSLPVHFTLFCVFCFLSWRCLMHSKCSVLVEKTGECTKAHTHTWNEVSFFT